MLLKWCAIGVLCAVCVFILKGLRSDMAAVLGVIGGMLVFGSAIITLASVIGEITEMLSFSEGARFAEPLIKALGVALITQITSSVCSECGAKAVGEGVVLVGKIEILILCLPQFKEVLGYALGLVAFE